MGRRESVAQLLAILLLILPTSGAAAAGDEIEGTLVVEGAFTLPAGSDLTLLIGGLYAPSIDSAQDLTLEAPVLKIHRIRETLVKADARALTLRQQAAYEVSTYTIHDARVGLRNAGPDAWLGLYPMQGELRIRSEDAVELAPRAFSHVGPALAPEPQPQPDRPVYAREHHGAHHYSRAVGTFDYYGKAGVKLQGGLLQVDARENSTTIDTRSRASGATESMTWVYLEAPSLRLSWTSTTPVEVVSMDGGASWTGQASLGAATGTLTGPSSSYMPTAGQTVLDGTFTAAWTPQEGQNAEVESLVKLKGTPREGSVGTMARVSSPSPVSWWSAGALGVVALVGLVSVQALTRARMATPKPRVRGETPVLPVAPALADEYVRRAIHYEMVDDVDAALDAYSKAEHIAATGESAFRAARLILLRMPRSDENLDEVVAFVRVALEREPDFVFEIVERSEFQLLARHPEFQRLVQDAGKEV